VGLIAVLLIVLFTFVIFKILALIMHVSIYMLTLPFKILGVLLAVLLAVFVVFPISLVGAIIGLIIAPIALFVVLIPFILVTIGIILLIKNS
jgi:hypothetical protein